MKDYLLDIFMALILALFFIGADYYIFQSEQESKNYIFGLIAWLFIRKEG